MDSGPSNSSGAQNFGQNIAQAVDELAKRLAAALPPGIATLKADAEANFKAVLQSGLTKLDLVTRQEFDVQAGVLKRTREKLEALEQRVAQLEAQK